MRSVYLRFHVSTVLCRNRTRDHVVAQRENGSPRTGFNSASITRRLRYYEWTRRTFRRSRSPRFSPARGCADVSLSCPAFGARSKLLQSLAVDEIIAGKCSYCSEISEHNRSTRDVRRYLVFRVVVMVRRDFETNDLFTCHQCRSSSNRNVDA